MPHSGWAAKATWDRPLVKPRENRTSLLYSEKKNYNIIMYTILAIYSNSFFHFIPFFFSFWIHQTIMVSIRPFSKRVNTFILSVFPVFPLHNNIFKNLIRLDVLRMKKWISFSINKMFCRQNCPNDNFLCQWKIWLWSVSIMKLIESDRRVERSLTRWNVLTDVNANVCKIYISSLFEFCSYMIRLYEMYMYVTHIRSCFGKGFFHIWTMNGQI